MLEVIQSSPLHTVQDLGRSGLGRFGMATAGPMDMHAAAWANHLLYNSPSCALLEITSGGFHGRFEQPTLFSITGGTGDFRLNDQPIRGWETYQAGPGDQLKLGALGSGMFTYIAVAGGFQLNPQFNSLATSRRDHLGGPSGEGKGLAGGDKIAYRAQQGLGHRRVPEAYIPDYSQALICDLIPRQLADQSASALSTLIGQRYEVTRDQSRVGYRLEAGDAIDISVPRYSAPIPLGGIQITAAGQPIVLMRDHQTLGGYPVIATVTRYALGQLAQRRPGQHLRFRPVSANSARNRLIELMEFFGEFS